MEMIQSERQIPASCSNSRFSSIAESEKIYAIGMKGLLKLKSQRCQEHEIIRNLLPKGHAILVGE